MLGGGTSGEKEDGGPPFIIIIIMEKQWNDIVTTDLIEPQGVQLWKYLGYTFGQYQQDLGCFFCTTRDGGGGDRCCLR